MPLRAHNAVEKYRLLALAIEAAVSMDRWDEVESMLSERDQILETLAGEKFELTALAESQLKGCDQHLIHFLTGTKNSVATQIKVATESAHLRKAYSSASPAISLDQPG